MILLLLSAVLLLTFQTIGREGLPPAWWPNLALVATVGFALHGGLGWATLAVFGLGYLTDLMTGFPKGASISVLALVVVLVRLGFARTDNIATWVLPLLTAFLGPVVLVGNILMAMAMAELPTFPVPSIGTLLAIWAINLATGILAIPVFRWAVGPRRAVERSSLEMPEG